MSATRNLAFITCAATLILIGVGVYVRATGSGLGCPDWPTCHGGIVPPHEQEALIESTHRFVAAFVGILVIATAVLAWRHFRGVPAVLWPAIAAVPLVGIQGVIGAITVWEELPAEIVATHLLLAMAILTVMAATALAMFNEVRGGIPPAQSAAAWRVGQRAIVALVLFAAVVWMGGYLGESGGSTACEGWPLCSGGVFPGADDQQITHMVHRYLAALLLVPLAWLVVAAWQERRALRWGMHVGRTVAVVYAAQVAIGALNVLYTFPDALTVTHTVLASLLWLALSAAALLGYSAQAVSRDSVSPTPTEAPA
ncbi:MAG: heme A synthase [Dehalococcoidia bacterium]|nr:heme A synthase [Dehalococcoidia bacterium]MYD29138.1 heme A synthase [Dehalococcoidia bacterium]